MNIYEKTLIDLYDYADEKFKTFNEKIVNCDKPLIGVRTPDIKMIAKRVISSDPYGYLSECKFQYYEDTLIFGLVIASFKYEEFLLYLNDYLSKACGWSHVDCFVSAVKCLKNRDNKSKFFNILQGKLTVVNGYELRFYIVAMMVFYLEDGYIDDVLKSACALCGNGYYNDMAIAWLLSVAFIKYKDKVVDVLLSGGLCDFVQNKTISKICDSFRVSLEDKNTVKTFRKR